MTSQRLRDWLGPLVIDVAAGPAQWVHMRRWDKFGALVRAEAHLPAVLVHNPMMVCAEEHSVIHSGRAAF